jgi:hypothetical protein
MTETLIHSLTLDQLRDHVQSFGYRAERLTDPAGQSLLRSATAGMNFDIRMGSKLPGQPGDTPAYVDFTFLAALAIRGGTLPDTLLNTLLNTWASTYRFARLRLDQNFLILDMDASIAGGISRNHLRATLATWDQLLQSFIAYLRNELPRLNTSNLASNSGPNLASDSAPKINTVASAQAKTTPKAPDPLAALANGHLVVTSDAPKAPGGASRTSPPQSAPKTAAIPERTAVIPPRTSPQANAQANTKAPDTRAEAAKAVAQALQTSALQTPALQTPALQTPADA